MRINMTDDPKGDIRELNKRMISAWLMSILSCFIALRLAAYLGMYGCFGLVLLLVPAVALYNGWKPWIRYIIRGE
jgi:hypothetical protein